MPSAFKIVLINNLVTVNVQGIMNKRKQTGVNPVQSSLKSHSVRDTLYDIQGVPKNRKCIDDYKIVFAKTEGCIKSF